MMKTHGSHILTLDEYGSVLVKIMMFLGGLGILVFAAFQVVLLISLQREHQTFKDAVETRIQSLSIVNLPDTQDTLTKEISTILDDIKAQYEPHHIQVNIEENTRKLSVQVWYSRSHNGLVISNPKQFYVHTEKTGLIVQAPTPTPAPVPAEPVGTPVSIAKAPSPTPTPQEKPSPTPTITVIRYIPATHVTDTTFTREVLRSPKPVMVFFWASWCGYCRKAAPAVDEASGRFSGTIKIVKVNVDKSKITASKYGIRGIPAFLFFKDGKLVSRKSGFSNKQRLLSLIRRFKEDHLQTSP